MPKTQVCIYIEAPNYKTQYQDLDETLQKPLKTKYESYKWEDEYDLLQDRVYSMCKDQ